jgi:asparagine synthase (glutamine-hydrolysing)
MCGIAGIFYFDHKPVNAQLLRAMTAAIAHRGPDGEDIYIDGAVGLGHRRLAIIDLSPAGVQPMSNEDRTIWITYNGEIYNFKEIRAELEKYGHVFRSSTDTEMIVHAYEQWGVKCLEKFNGMFAFALWDANLQRLWLARDRMGVKPLFYLLSPDRLLFGSEIKAILADSTVNRALDYEALAYYLALNYTPAPYTLFSGICQLEPGMHLLINADGTSQLTQYWDVVYQEEHYRSEKAYVEEFQSLLEDAVRLRLVSDVPFGSFLSGGADSSSIAYWMSRNMGEPVKTFSIGFDEETFSELGYARQVAERIHADHHERIVTADVEELLPKLVWHAEEPTANSSMVAVYHLAQMTREWVTMSLSGDGADEILAGYETYQAYYLRQLYHLIPAWLRQKVLAPLVFALPTSDAKMSLETKLKRFINGAELSAEDAHAYWRVIFDTALRHQLLSPILDKPGAQSDFVDLYRSLYKKTNARLPLNRLLYVDARFYLPNDSLVKVDRMAMAHGLEVRTPFLDYRLVEFAAQVPPSLKLKGFRHKKYLLKAAMKDKLPASVLYRKKAGFNIPNALWIKGKLKPFVLDCLALDTIKQIGLNNQLVQNLLQDHFDGRSENSHQIWNLLTLALWHQKFIAGK